MVRGLVYSLIAVSFFLAASIGWMFLQSADEDSQMLLAGWLLLISFFAVGPLFFALGYRHHLLLHPKDPKWDSELGE